MYLVDSVFPAPLSPVGRGEREGGRERERDVNQAHFKHASLFCLTADNNGLTLLE